MTRLHSIVVCLAALISLVAEAPEALARPLASIKERGSIVLCANPNALPYSAKNNEREGIQIELARALAERLGVGLDIGWVVFPNQIVRVNCDFVLDFIVNEDIERERHVRLSKPYHKSGVVLAFRPGLDPVTDYKDLASGLRVGAMVGSVARLTLGRADHPTIPFTFEDEMLEELGKGEIDVAALSPASVDFYNLTHPNASMKSAPAFASVSELNWSVAVGLRKADDALLDAMNEALAQLIEDGTIARIYAKYGVEHTVPDH
jgi:ABC-type amino acid transport substrate-binding protein